VEALTQRLISADGHIPADFTKSDMDTFLAEADPKVVSEIFEKIVEKAEPLPDSDVDAASLNQSYARSETYTEYSFETGVATTHSFAEDLDTFSTTTVDTKANGNTSVEDKVPIYAWELITRAYPEYWTESAPQGYVDCKSTCKIVIMYILAVLLAAP